MMRIFIALLVCVSLHAKRIVVTGGAGLIGSHLCERLMRQGHDVFCVDNLSSGSIRTMQELEKHERFHKIIADVANPVYIREEIDEIYHLACPHAASYSDKEPLQVLETCYVGTVNMLDLARREKAKFLFVSSMEVQNAPFCESRELSGVEDGQKRRASFYEGKRVAETLVLSYRKIYGLDAKIVRLSDVYGPRMHPPFGRVVSKFIMQAINNEAITVYGKGNQTVPVCFVSDVVEGLERVMGLSQKISGPINLGSGERVSVLSLAHNIIRAANCQSEIVLHPRENIPLTWREEDFSLAQTLIRWAPKVSKDEGLRQTIEYYRARKLKERDAR